MIEFSNRLITVPVCIAAGCAWLGALRRRPYRRDLVWLGALLPLGVIAQAVLGGLTVQGKLDYGWVMGHFALSMLILLAGVVLAWRARHEPVKDRGGGREAPGPGRGRDPDGRRPRRPARRWHALLMPLRASDEEDGAPTDPMIVKGVRGLVGAGRADDLCGYGRHCRWSARGRRTRPEDQPAGLRRARHDGLRHPPPRRDRVRVQHRRRCPVVAGAPAPAAPMVQRSLTMLCVLLAVQGAVGLDQYETHLPTELVWVHVALVCRMSACGRLRGGRARAGQSRPDRPRARRPRPSARWPRRRVFGLRSPQTRLARTRIPGN